MPLVVLCGPGQAGDAPMFPILLGHLRVATSGPGRPRTRPEKVRGDEAYSSKAIRTLLADRRITAVIPQPADQSGHRKRRGSAAGGHHRSTPEITRAATLLNAASNAASSGAVSPPEMTNTT